MDRTIKKAIIAVLAVSTVCALSWLAYGHFRPQQAAQVVEPVEDCTSCSARHKAYAKSKEKWKKMGQSATGPTKTSGDTASE